MIATLALAPPARAVPALAHSTQFSLPDAVHAQGIAFDERGELWFAGVASAGDGTIVDGSVIGHVAADGTVTEYRLARPPERRGATAIAPGPDGAIWFTEGRAHVIGRVSEAGEITRLRSPRNPPGRIVAGADGNLWFTVPRKGRIARMTPAGELTEFQFGRRSRPGDVALGPDGNVWFTLANGSKIGRVTPSGRTRLFHLPPATMPRRLVAATDGVWFSEGSRLRAGRRGRNRVGHITPDGRVRQLRVPAPAGTGEIAVGPEGNVWFTTGDAEIGWVSPLSGHLGPRLCLNPNCTLPPSSLAFSPAGQLWFGTGVERCASCGGGSAMSLARLPGTVGRLDPPSGP